MLVEQNKTHTSGTATNVAVTLTGRPMLVGPNGERLTPQVVERRILAGLGGKPWTLKDLRSADIREAKKVWAELRTAVGFKGTTGGWVTTDKTNPKLGKAGIPTVGVTLHAARAAAVAWTDLSATRRTAIAAAVDLSVEHLSDLLDVTVCPHATSCVEACVVDRSRNGQMDHSRRSRLLRNVLTVARPDLALALTAEMLEQTADKAGGRSKARWRVNISDDIRWELVAPGLLVLSPKAYSYTKWPVAQRPGHRRLRLVYSANERWTDQDIVDACATGHRVAVVYDCKAKQLPATWNGVRVVDGDKTDDLWSHPAGCIVGLAAKGVSHEIKEAMKSSGFSRPV